VIVNGRLNGPYRADGWTAGGVVLAGTDKKRGLSSVRLMIKKGTNEQGAGTCNAKFASRGRRECEGIVILSKLRRRPSKERDSMRDTQTVGPVITQHDPSPSEISLGKEQRKVEADPTKARHRPLKCFIGTSRTAKGGGGSTGGIGVRTSGVASEAFSN